MTEIDMQEFAIDRSRYDDAANVINEFEAPEGLTEELVRQISLDKNEPEWMLKKRLQGLEWFMKTPLPSWGPKEVREKLDLNKIKYYIKPGTQEATKWEDVPEEIRKVAERIGIPEAEKRELGGAGFQFDSQMAYHNLRKELEEQGVIFENMDVAVQKYPELVKKYFMTSCIPVNDHKFIMLHASVWSGGTFIYIPENVKVRIPLQAYFRMNARSGGQFEHTLIIADKNSEVAYIEGCFTKGNKVVTNPDYKNIEDIKKGQKVLTHNGGYKKVKEIYQWPYKGNLYKIKLYGNSVDEIEVTEEHPFLYVDKKSKRDRNKEFNIRWNMPRFFKNGDYLAVPINKTIVSKDFCEIEIDKWDTEKRKFKKIKINLPSNKEFFRLAGYYLAEGSISGGHYLTFAFSSKEKDLINDVKKLIKNIFGFNCIETYHKNNNGTNVVVCSTDLCKIFESLFGKGANNKSIPHWMMLESTEKQKQLIRSYFNGDGNYYKQKCKSGLKEVIRINSISEKLARQCRDILLRMGIVSFINSRDRSKENRKTMYTIGITGEYMKWFGKIVGLNIDSRLNNKNRASMFGITKDFAFYPIRNIEKREVKNELVYNLSVEDNETYCVAGTVVHNCSAPVYSENALHAGCVEIHVLEGARVRYMSVENWSKNTFNLNTKRAIVQKNGIIEWLNGNMGSGVTMLYPCSVLVGENAKSDSLGIAFAATGQNQDTGSKVVHAAPNTYSTIKAKSISKGGGISSYRGSVLVTKNAKNTKCSVNCDALLIDDKSVSNTYPFMKIDTNKVDIAHEASVGKIGDEEIFYLMSRGLSEEQAMQMVVSGFIEPVVKQLPLEYAVELNKLIELEMEGTVG
ncbi:SufD family Fe-S cluster assembly protein [Candidatus Woesearchaeota archaeon]|nr:SufD family Fe-S cluster assembly protein [Candidatus Woesearchaeota archaeon]